jgi:nitrite reductase/ring-hydroxylating ferredoxin subunit
VNAGGTMIVVGRVGDRCYAVQNMCAHLPLPLGGSKLDGEVLTCPFHHSQYSICTGTNLDWVRGLGPFPMPDWTRRLLAMGRKPQALKTYPLSQDGDQLFVEIDID